LIECIRDVSVVVFETAMNAEQAYNSRRSPPRAAKRLHMSKQWSALAVAALHATTSAQGFLNVRDFGASGSAFETAAFTRAGSNQILVKDVGDFRVGQQVMVSKCHVHYEDCRLRGPGSPYREWKRLSGTGQDTPSSQTTETTS